MVKPDWSHETLINDKKNGLSEKYKCISCDWREPCHQVLKSSEPPPVDCLKPEKREIFEKLQEQEEEISIEEVSG